MQHSDRNSPEASEFGAEEFKLTISAWMDGDAETAMPRTVFTEPGREAWHVYHLIGDTLRTPELVRPVSAQFQQRLASAIAAEPLTAAQASIVGAPATDNPRAEPSIRSAAPPLAQPRAHPHRNPLKTGWRLVWPGLAMAAAVASVVWMARPFFVPESGVTVQQMASADAVGSKSPAMRDYVSAHRQIAGPTGVRQVSFGAAR